MIAYGLDLPCPPTVNHYWGVAPGGRRFVGARGVAFRKVVALAMVGKPKMTGRVGVYILFNPPDRRRRDIDNLLKCTLDALEKAGAFDDDSQVDTLCIDRGEVVAGGKFHVELMDVSYATKKNRTTGKGVGTSSPSVVGRRGSRSLRR